MKTKFNFTAKDIGLCFFYGVLGLLFIILHGRSLDVVLTIVGVLLIALGVIDIIENKNLTQGVLEISFGAIIILFGWLITTVALIILGALLIAKAVLYFLTTSQASFNSIIEPILCVVVGMLLIIARWTALDVMCIITGVLLLLNSLFVVFEKYSQ